MKNTFTATEKITASGVVMALYIAVMLATQNFAFGQYQIRIATSLYALSAVFPFLVVPLALANFLSNVLMGGLGVLDMAGGLLVGLATGMAVLWGARTRWSGAATALAITLIPGLGVPVWLSVILNVPYSILAVSLVIGQIIPGLCGALLAAAVKERLDRQ
ncbi:MAG: QueT transporter family protein [Pyramidobacter sp.]|nr:QueT transporter family protein [Pyramidobacter sp.]